MSVSWEEYEYVQEVASRDPDAPLTRRQQYVLRHSLSGVDVGLEYGGPRMPVQCDSSAIEVGSRGEPDMYMEGQRMVAGV